MALAQTCYIQTDHFVESAEACCTYKQITLFKVLKLVQRAQASCIYRQITSLNVLKRPESWPLPKVVIYGQITLLTDACLFKGGGGGEREFVGWRG